MLFRSSKNTIFLWIDTYVTCTYPYSFSQMILYIFIKIDNCGSGKEKKARFRFVYFFFVDHIREYMWTKKIYAPTKRTYVPVYFLFPFFVFYKCGCEFCCKKQASCSSKSKGTFAMYIGVSTFSAGMDSPLGQHPVSTSPHIVRFFCVFNTKFGYKSKL
jgi:hypothetical protein